MSLLDLLALIADNLGRRKTRVALTAVGVVIGTAAVVVLVSMAIGLQMNAQQQLGGIGDLTVVTVWPGYREGPIVTGGGVGGGGGGPVGPGGPSSVVLITDQTLAEFSALPGVIRVIPRDFLQVGGLLRLGRLETYPGLIGVGGLTDLTDMGVEAAQGTTVLAKGTAIVGALVARNFYDPRLRPGQEPPPPPDLFDQNLKLTLIKYTTDGQEVRRSLPIKITGVLKETRYEPDYSIYVSLEEVTAFNEWGFNRRINRNKDGYQMVMVKVDNVDNVLDVNDSIVGMGYQASAPQQYVQGINSFYMVLQVIFGGVGAISLLVAAIGIANTMAMAILERTREIGLMKAIGATNRDVLSVFLGEAAGIGFVGGVGGVLLGWSAGQIINVLAVVYLSQQAAQQGGLPTTVAVYTPVWLPLFALFFATLIGLVSGLYPALRAATLIPVNALKYE